MGIQVIELGCIGQQPTREFKQWMPAKNKTRTGSRQTVAMKIGTRVTSIGTLSSKNPTSDRPDIRCMGILPFAQGAKGGWPRILAGAEASKGPQAKAVGTRTTYEQARVELHLVGRRSGVRRAHEPLKQAYSEFIQEHFGCRALPQRQVMS